MMLLVEELIAMAFAVNRPWGIEPVGSFPYHPRPVPV